MFQVTDEVTKTKYYTGRSRAVVIDSRDPLQRGRIRVDHPVVGETEWIDYLGDPHKFDPPKIGDIVYIEADCGWHNYPIAHGRMIKGEDNSPEIPSEFRREVPTNRGIFSPGGHLIEVDDGVAPTTQTPQDTNFTTQDRGIRITSAGNNKVHIIEDVDNGNTFILIEDAGGNLIKLDYNDNKLTINSIGTTQFDTAEDRSDTIGGDMSEDVSGDRSETVGGDLQIDVSGDITVNCTNATVNTSANAEITVGADAKVDASGKIEIISGSNTEITTGTNTKVTAGANAEVMAAAQASITAPLIRLNGGSGDILTTTTSPVVDSIFGIPTVGVPTVKAG